MSMFQVPPGVHCVCKRCENPVVYLVIMHCAERWILLSKMKYKLLCCFSIIFLNVKKHNSKGNPCQNFQFFSHTGPRFPFFEAFFVAAPPSNKEERGENFWENIGSVVRWYFGQYIWGLPNYYLANSDWMMMTILMPLHCITMSWWWWWWWCP